MEGNPGDAAGADSKDNGSDLKSDATAVAEAGACAIKASDSISSSDFFRLMRMRFLSTLGASSTAVMEDLAPSVPLASSSRPEAFPSRAEPAALLVAFLF